MQFERKLSLIYLSLVGLVSMGVSGGRSQIDKWSTLHSSRGYEVIVPPNVTAYITELNPENIKLENAESIDFNYQQIDGDTKIFGYSIDSQDFHTPEKVATRMQSLIFQNDPNRLRPPIGGKDSTLFDVTKFGDDQINWSKRIICGTRMITLVCIVRDKNQLQSIKKIQVGQSNVPRPIERIFNSFKCSSSIASKNLLAPVPGMAGWFTNQEKVPAEKIKPIKHENQSSIAISAPMTVHFILIDPSGRKTGFDPVEKRAYNEIPNSSYGEEGLSAPAEVDPDDKGDSERALNRSQGAIPGEYQIQVFGKVNTKFKFEIRAFDLNGSPGKDHYLSGTIPSAGMTTIKFVHSDQPEPE